MTALYKTTLHPNCISFKNAWAAVSDWVITLAEKFTPVHGTSFVPTYGAEIRTCTCTAVWVMLAQGATAPLPRGKSREAVIAHARTLAQPLYDVIGPQPQLEQLLDASIALSLMQPVADARSSLVPVAATIIKAISFNENVVLH